MQQLTINTLQNVTISELVKVFNQSFADYLLPFRLSDEDFKTKLKGENIALHYSAGAFAGSDLVGFILTGTDEINGNFIAYNAGTGVVPNYRGNYLTLKMFEFLLPFLANRNIRHHQLEVLVENQVALKVYQKAGFQIQRKLSCYRGNITENNLPETITVKEISFSGIAALGNYSNQIPAFQNSLNAVLRTIDLHVVFGAFTENKFAGFLIYSPANFRVKQFGVQKEYRRKGIATALFMKVRELEKEKQISIINAEDADKATLLFIEKMGLTKYIQQYEMSFIYAN
jgi:ribosomal protein S18 acetylase RimI-like enzyme